MDKMNASADDPWHWTVDDLVAQICRSPSLFQTAGCRPDTLPDAVALETQLRDQHVTGDTFLTALDSTTLRTELGVHSLSQRLTLFAVIKSLRQRSDAY